MYFRAQIPHTRTDLRHSSIREAMPCRLIMLTTQMRLMPHMAGSGVVEQHHALWRSNITFSPSEPSGGPSSITLKPWEQTNAAINPNTRKSHSSAASYLLDVLRYETSSHFLVNRDEEERFGLRGTLHLHLLEAQVIVHHLPNFFNLWEAERTLQTTVFRFIRKGSP